MSTCEYFLIEKISKEPFRKGIRVEYSLQLIYSDIWSNEWEGQAWGSYFIIFIDNYTRYGYIFLISHKSETLSYFIKFLTLVEINQIKKVKALKTVWSREYISEQFKKLCDKRGIDCQLIILGTPQSNGLVERRNRMILEMVRFMMAHANLSITFRVMHY